ncbi:MAG: PucR family transcriptional regulator [Nitriliruptoraceae bacterium]
MSLTLEDLLALEPFNHARPEVLVDNQRPVSWVHSSEIYEIAPLLDGGEVLLTTGLGLVGADDEALARYATAIAERGASALVLELGRTFVHPPTPMVTACERTGLGLVVLHAVVPFVKLARVGNERILDHEATSLRYANAAGRRLAEVLVHRRGVQALVADIEEAAGVPVQLVDVDGKVHAGPAAIEAPTVAREVVLADGVWGQLVAAARDTLHLDVVLDRGVEALRIALAELHGGRRRDAARTLLLDLVRGEITGAEDVARRAAALGVPADREVAALVAVPGPDGARDAIVTAARRALRSVVRTDLVAAGDQGVLAVVDAGAAQRATASRLLEALDAELTGERDRIRHLALGTPVPRLGQVAASFGGAFVAAATARSLGTERRLLLPRDIAVDRLLLESDDAVLERLVAGVLGPLLDHDATRRTQLLPTLLAYLAAGRSKAAAANRLGVRRQTVHERLDRITAVLDLPDDDPAALTTVEVAARAWQVRTAGAREA